MFFVFLVILLPTSLFESFGNYLKLHVRVSKPLGVRAVSPVFLAFKG